MSEQNERNTIPAEPQPVQEEPMQDSPELHCEAPESEKMPRKRLPRKMVPLIAAGVVVVAAIAVVIYLQSTVFSRAVSAMLQEYPYADNSRAPDDSYMEIDTNPYDRIMTSWNCGSSLPFTKSKMILSRASSF